MGLYDLLLSHRISLYVLDIIFSSDMFSVNVFSKPVVCFFIFLTVAFSTSEFSF